MASTRLRMLKNEKQIFNRENRDIVDNRLYVQRGYAYQDALPCAGINVGHMPNNTLSYNATDVESGLFGLSNDFVPDNNPNNSNIIPISVQSKHLKDLAFFERPQVFLPEPLVIENNQRPKIP